MKKSSKIHPIINNGPCMGLNVWEVRSSPAYSHWKTQLAPPEIKQRVQSRTPGARAGWEAVDKVAQHFPTEYQYAGVIEVQTSGKFPPEEEMVVVCFILAGIARIPVILTPEAAVNANGNNLNSLDSRRGRMAIAVFADFT